jgi:hypothetical protein
VNDPSAAIEAFNRIEALVWFATAAGLPLIIKSGSRTQRLSVLAASCGFVLFGVTDLVEAETGGDMPAWLWASKIICAAFLLACRFNFIGWGKFKFTDRWFLFGLFCLAVSVVLMVFG